MKRRPIGETVIISLLDGQYSNPVRVIAFNTAEGWSRDVSEDIAVELAMRLASLDEDAPAGVQDLGEILQPLRQHALGLRGPS